MALEILKGKVTEFLYIKLCSQKVRAQISQAIEIHLKKPKFGLTSTHLSKFFKSVPFHLWFLLNKTCWPAALSVGFNITSAPTGLNRGLQSVTLEKRQEGAEALRSEHLDVLFDLRYAQQPL